MATNPTCHARFLHAVPDAPAVDIYINGVPLHKNFKYKDFTKYFSAVPGIYNVKLFHAGRTESPIFTQSFEVDDTGIYTVALTGLSDDMYAEIIPDNKTYFDKSKAYVRFINLSPFDTNFDVTLNQHPEVQSLIYTEISDYCELKPENYYLRAHDSRTNEMKLSVPKMLLKAGKKYAIYIVGVDGGKPELQILVPLEGSTYL